MLHCQNCGKRTGHKRALGFGTFFMVIITCGFWILAIPWYPKRCSVCGERWSVNMWNTLTPRQKKAVAVTVAVIFLALSSLIFIQMHTSEQSIVAEQTTPSSTTSSTPDIIRDDVAGTTRPWDDKFTDSIKAEADADSVPAYNTKRECDIFAEADGGPGAVHEDFNACLAYEQNSRTELENIWSRYPLRIRECCSWIVRSPKQGESNGSYQFLLLCLHQSLQWDAQHPENLTSPPPSFHWDAQHEEAQTAKAGDTPVAPAESAKKAENPSEAGYSDEEKAAALQQTESEEPTKPEEPPAKVEAAPEGEKAQAAVKEASGPTPARPYQSAALPTSGQSRPYYWYYCRELNAYYPYVRSCPGKWVPVIPTDSK
ncbi:MAG: hypothetical protein ABSC19_14450 [Syntrophorhabdales bacterium]